MRLCRSNTIKEIKMEEWGGGSNGLGPPARTTFVYLILGISDYLSQITTEIRIKYLNCVFVRSEKIVLFQCNYFGQIYQFRSIIVYVKIRFIRYCSRSANRSIQII